MNCLRPFLILFGVRAIGNARVASDSLNACQGAAYKIVPESPGLMMVQRLSLPQYLVDENGICCKMANPLNLTCANAQTVVTRKRPLRLTCEWIAIDELSSPTWHYQCADGTYKELQTERILRFLGDGHYEVCQSDECTTRGLVADLTCKSSQAALGKEAAKLKIDGLPLNAGLQNLVFAKHEDHYVSMDDAWVLEWPKQRLVALRGNEILNTTLDLAWVCGKVDWNKFEGCLTAKSIINSFIALPLAAIRTFD
eukprot:Gregarina_sp_Poly_1__4524@NODE_242_length_10830_cov_108_673047_g213_i0_p5_GENE_NODE_242_length_10830_cov_108_673047_g213_i0NODE_242_length_10830_cov_108_673047_g213_i0_p5_ORF_typecomplete_len254_score25_48MIT_LIKE_ACTX/PF17556_2/0_26_NODE_242_length_10830_cov_108_673047_g213_i013082069